MKIKMLKDYVFSPRGWDVMTLKAGDVIGGEVKDSIKKRLLSNGMAVQFTQNDYNKKPETRTVKTKDVNKPKLEITKFRNGDGIVVKYRNSKKKATFIEYCGGSEKGKVRVKLENDNKEYREIPEKNIVSKGTE